MLENKKKKISEIKVRQISQFGLKLTLAIRLLGQKYIKKIICIPKVSKKKNKSRYAILAMFYSTSLFGAFFPIFCCSLVICTTVRSAMFT